MTLPPGHRPIPGQIMKLTYFFLGFAKSDHLAFPQVCNLWAMTALAITRWFKLRHDAQRANGFLNKLKAIHDGARRGQQLARESNNYYGAPRRDRKTLAHPRNRAFATMEDAIVCRVSCTLSAQSCGRN